MLDPSSKIFQKKEPRSHRVLFALNRLHDYIKSKGLFILDLRVAFLKP